MNKEVRFVGREEMIEALQNQKFGTTTSIHLSLSVDPLEIKVKTIKQTEIENNDKSKLLGSNNSV